MQTSTTPRPRYASIRQTPSYFPGIKESYLRGLNKRGLLPGPCSGVKKLVDLCRFEAMLDSGELDHIDDAEVTRNV